MKMLKVSLFAFCMTACALDPADPPDEGTADWELIIARLDDPQAIANAEAKAALIASLPASTPTSPVPQHASCGTAGPNLQNQVIADAASPSGGAQQRSGSSTGCAAVGALQPTDDARYFCFTFANDGFTWTYNSNQRTGVRGWTRDDLLRNFGSSSQCPF